jgi:hypothetical protein
MLATSKGWVLCAMLPVLGCQTAEMSVSGMASKGSHSEDTEVSEIDLLERSAVFYISDLKKKRCDSESGDEYNQAVAHIDSNYLRGRRARRLHPDTRKTYLFSVLYWRTEIAKEALHNGCYNVAHRNCSELDNLARGRAYLNDKAFAMYCLTHVRRLVT